MRIRKALLFSIALLSSLSGASQGTVVSPGNTLKPLRPWIFPVFVQNASFCKALDSEPKLTSFLLRYGVKLPPKRTLNIDWHSGNFAIAVLTGEGEEPQSLESGFSDENGLLTVESQQSNAPGARLFVFEWNANAHHWRGGSCYYLSRVNKKNSDRMCLSSGASTCFATQLGEDASR
jgi:hypothetical protein